MRVLGLYNLLALVACAGLAYGVMAEMDRPAPALPEIAVAAPVPTTVAAPKSTAVFRMPSVNAFNQLAARPPFSQTRRPPRAKPAAKPVVQAQKPKPVAQKPASPPPDITLVGVMINAQKSVAMVRKPGAEELLRLAKGENVDGWLVEGVLPDRLLLSQEGKVLEFELSEAAQRGGENGAAEGNSRQRRRRQ